MRAPAAWVAAAVFAAACGGGHADRARVSSEHDLSQIQAARTSMPSGTSGAPISGVIVTGTITNTDSAPLRCRPAAFLLVDENGNAFAPRTQWCDVPAIGPRRSSGFTATFATSNSSRLELRFEHPDGTYESHVVTVPRA